MQRHGRKAKRNGNAVTVLKAMSRTPWTCTAPPNAAASGLLQHMSPCMGPVTSTRPPTLPCHLLCVRKLPLHPHFSAKSRSPLDRAQGLSRTSEVRCMGIESLLKAACFQGAPVLHSAPEQPSGGHPQGKPAFPDFAERGHSRLAHEQKAQASSAPMLGAAASGQGDMAAGFAAKLPSAAALHAGLGHTGCVDSAEADSALVPVGASLRFNAGHFLQQAKGVGIDAAEMAERLRQLLAHATDNHLLRVLASKMGQGGLPVRLLQPLVPGLQETLVTRGTAALNAAVKSVPRGLRHDTMHYDGLHLTMPGLAATLLAWHSRAEAAVCPGGFPIVMSPSPPTSEGDGGGEDSNSVSAGACGSAPPRTAAEAAGSSTIPMVLLLQRWPHLRGLLAFPPPGACQACHAYLTKLSQGQEPLPPDTLCDLVRAHQEHLDTPHITLVMPPGCLDVHYTTANTAMSNLLGMTHWGTDPAKPTRWLHPACYPRRCLAFIAAACWGVSSFQYEGCYLRRLPDTGLPASVQGDSLCRMTPLFGCETLHVLRYPTTGALLSITSGISDVIATKAPVDAESLEQGSGKAPPAVPLTSLRPLAPLPEPIARSCTKLGIDPDTALTGAKSEEDTVKLYVDLLFQLLVPERGPSDPPHPPPRLCSPADHSVLKWVAARSDELRKRLLLYTAHARLHHLYKTFAGSVVYMSDARSSGRCPPDQARCIGICQAILASLLTPADALAARRVGDDPPLSTHESDVSHGH